MFNRKQKRAAGTPINGKRVTAIDDKEIQKQLGALAQSSYMDGAAYAYQDVINILENLIATVPPGIRLTNEVQANIALLASLRDGVTVKREQTLAAGVRVENEATPKPAIIMDANG